MVGSNGLGVHAVEWYGSRGRKVQGGWGLKEGGPWVLGGLRG